jgi:hypothetical protein
MQVAFTGTVYRQVKVKTSEQTVSLAKRSFRVHIIELNPWPLLWTVIGAWMWFGVLHLARII